ncbi:hypothetical protein [Thiomonas intermedia]|uniref:hypothetical protein n=1 Tax=Thiomonas intermedia TaxID=926 RepID=UPI0012AB9DBA|nr:hypothetical protein [Thiomonas intermedia]
MNAFSLLIWSIELIAAGAAATFLIADSLPVIADDVYSGSTTVREVVQPPAGCPEQIST